MIHGFLRALAVTAPGLAKCSGLAPIGLLTRLEQRLREAKLSTDAGTIGDPQVMCAARGLQDEHAAAPPANAVAGKKLVWEEFPGAVELQERGLSGHVAFVPGDALDNQISKSFAGKHELTGRARQCWPIARAAALSEVAQAASRVNYYKNKRLGGEVRIDSKVDVQLTV